MEQLIFGTVDVKVKTFKDHQDVTLMDDAMNTVEFKDLPNSTASLLGQTIRNLNTLARDHDLATILAFEREGIDEIPDLIAEKRTEPHDEIDGWDEE